MMKDRFEMSTMNMIIQDIDTICVLIYIVYVSKKMKIIHFSTILH